MSAGDVERLAEIAAGAVARVISHGSDHPDMETYARIHNEGWDAAMLAQVAPDPSTPEDWLAAHDADVAAAARREGAAEALRQAADRWTQGAWSDVMLPKPTPPAVPVIAYANRLGDWLRARAERVAAAPHEEQP